MVTNSDTVLRNGNAADFRFGCYPLFTFVEYTRLFFFKSSCILTGKVLKSTIGVLFLYKLIYFIFKNGGMC